MTLSFKELIEAPAGSLVYTTDDGSLTLDDRLAGPHYQPIWGYSEETLNEVLFGYDRSRFDNHFPGWKERKYPRQQTAFYGVNSMIQPTAPLGLLLNKVFLYLNGTGLPPSPLSAGDCLFVEMFIEGKAQFIRMNVHNFFSQSVVINALKNKAKPGMTDWEKAMMDLRDFELFQSARLVLQ